MRRGQGSSSGAPRASGLACGCMDSHTPRAERGMLLLVLSYVGFVSLGLPDTVLGAAWPSVRAEFGLALSTAGAALSLTTSGIILSSVASAQLRRRWGNGRVLVVSTLLAAAALLTNAAAPSFGVMLAAALLA